MANVMEVMPVSSAARVLGVSMQRVYQLIEAGVLVGRKEGSTVLVTCQSVKARLEVKRGGYFVRRSRRRGLEPTV